MCALTLVSAPSAAQLSAPPHLHFERCRSSTDRAPMPIVALTAHAFAEDVEHSRRAGCNEHPVKPIRKTVLLDVLDPGVRRGAERRLERASRA